MPAKDDYNFALYFRIHQRQVL